VANCRVSMNTNKNSNETTYKDGKKQRKIDQLRLLILKSECLKVSIHYKLHMQQKRVELKGSGWRRN
jgi:hypothetical protein